MTNLWTVCYFTLGITLTGGMLLLFKKIFQDKLSARWHYLVWLVLLVRAVLPGNVRLFSTGFSLNNLWMEGMKRVRGFVEMGRDSLLSTPFGMGGGDLSLLKDAPVGAWSVTDRLFAVYLAGVAAVLLYDIVIYGKLRREISKGREASPALKEKIRATEKKYDLPKQERVKVCEGLETPFLCGFFRPVLMIPAGQEETIDEKVLLHEMLHLKHHDVLVNFALHLLQALQWFNPFVYGLCRVIRNDSEALCDQRALERLEGEEKREYGLLLLGMADHHCASRIGTTSMANGAKNIKTRVRRIADFGRVPKGAAFATACITVMLCLASVSFAYEPKYFETDFTEAGISSKKDLEILLEDARYFKVTLPEMAANLFVEALTEKDLVKMALLVPAEEFDSYKDWVVGLYDDWDEDGFSMQVDLEHLHPYGFYTDVENGSMVLTDYKKDAFVEGMFRFRDANWVHDEHKWTEEYISFRMENENGWKIYITEREKREFADHYLWEEDFLKERIEQGEYQEYGDWRFTMAKWGGSPNWSGSGFQGMHLNFFSTPVENAFSEEITLFANHAVYVEYIGEMYSEEEWREEKDAEIPVFFVCPAEMPSEELWENSHGEIVTRNVGSSGSSSDGDAWAVALITEDSRWEYLNGDKWCETFDETMEELERPYEFRIYTQKGELLVKYPLEGGAPYEK